MSLISDSELAAGALRYAAHQQARKAQASAPVPVAAPPAPAPAPAPYEYKVRSPEQWQKRVDQNWKTNRSFHPKWEKPASKPRKSRVRKPVAAPPVAVAIDCASETVLAGGPVKPRRTRKKQTAFMTDAPELFPPGAASVNP